MRTCIAAKRRLESQKANTTLYMCMYKLNKYIYIGTRWVEFAQVMSSSICINTCIQP